MDQKQLINLANNYKDQKEFITNEETAKMSLVVPFIRLLGYDPNLPREVRLEYKAEFTQGDGKRLRDSMDFALFDKSGFKPLMIIETKPLGTNLKSNSPQLARYIAQLPDLHFGILTDGCNYLFYGDLESPNIMDSDPFFTFSLDDSKIDWTTVASFLTKFSRDAFNAETLLTDAENSRYRQAMVDKLVNVLRAPAEDEEFMKWLTAGIYTGLRTAKVMTRMAEIARSAIEPALLHVMGDEFIDQLKNRIHAAQKAKADIIEPAKEAKEIDDNNTDDDADDVKIKKSSIITTEDELQAFEIIKGIIEDSDYDVEKILYKDTVNYFNVSYDKPTRWFIRVFADSKRKNIVTLVELEKAQELGEGFDVEKAPKVFGVSRIFIEDIEDITKLNDLVLESLKTLCGN
ncbi:hypothetical protein QUF90_13075 [Desulfococcaceae bacterium HSG9]|nr:hypothetical protein [Desulfococcaceae bacterium HSG9]